eukprot:TRINITY_DN6147_c0_g1_i1.p1 TRINITY_DN6147_c0_g1~~TRINITY_DN6147_c0_g1_i1.p1  ORF type:complete len:193 (+),score=43.74 TRINITY_DN6147_c0_g1_i1:83-661(+)
MCIRDRWYQRRVRVTPRENMAIPNWALKLVMSLPPSAQQVLFNPRALCVSTIPAALLLAYAPHFARYGVTYSQLPAADAATAWMEDNQDPRNKGPARAASVGVQATINRLGAAHINSLEVFPGFAAAVLSAIVLKAKPLKVLKPAFLFLVARFLYILAYAFGVNPPMALLRSALFIGAHAQVFKIFGLALSN